MAKLVACKTCKKEVAQGVRKCPHCGQTNPTISSKQGLFSVVFLVLLVVVLVNACGSSPEEIAANKAATAERECSSGSSAKGYAQTYIKKHLKSPASADFPIGGGTLSKVADCQFLVSSYVDSQNSFGGTIRSNTKVLLNYSSEAERWLLADIEIQ